jgi:carbohydrate-selective porin OprB
VKVHKLNEMGEIVDKKGHRAWDMACALQLGIRVNVRIEWSQFVRQRWWPQTFMGAGGNEQPGELCEGSGFRYIPRACQAQVPFVS